MPNPARLAVPDRPGVVGAAPALPGVPRLRLPPASSCCCDSTTAKVSHLHSMPRASWRTNPYERASKRASHSGSSAWRTRAWWHRSMITGMPSGLFLVLSWAFGIYTRLTATGRHELRVACTCTATSARARAVNATRPSIPAVARPALRCVTCRTLTSVFDQFRSMSFCRFRAFARSPSRTALKILRRSRRTRSSCIRQSTCCQASHRTHQAGPPVRSPRCPTCPSVPTFTSASSSKAHLPTSAPIRGSRHQARYPAGYPTTIQEKDLVTQLSVSRCLSTTGIRFLGTLSRREFRPDHSRPTSTAHAYLRTRCGPRRGFTTFHTRETRTGPGALFTPRMTVFAGHRVVRSRRLPPPNGRSLPPRHCVPTRDVDVTRHQQEFPDSRPIPVLPLTCDRHGRDDGPWAFPWASHPTDQEPDTHATAGTRSNTDPELRLRHPSNLLHELTHNVRLRVATTATVLTAPWGRHRRSGPPNHLSSCRPGGLCDGIDSVD